MEYLPPPPIPGIPFQSPFAFPSSNSVPQPQPQNQNQNPSKDEYNEEEFQRFMQEKLYNETHEDENGFYEFPFREFPLRKFCIILGSRDCGKSNTLYYMLYRMRELLHTCVFFCSSESSDSVMEGMIPDCFIYPQIDTECLMRIRNRFERIHTTFKKKQKMPQNCKTADVLILFDDVLHDKKGLNSEEFERAILSGRHDGEGMWGLIQYAPKFPKEKRHQIDYLFLQQFKTDGELEYIYKEFASAVVPNYEEFKALMNIYTRNYGTLVLKMKGDPPNIWYMRALDKKKMPKFRLDAGTMFQMAEEHEKPIEQTGTIVDYNSKDIFDFKKSGTNSNQKSTPLVKNTGGRGKKATTSVTWKLPS